MLKFRALSSGFTKFFLLLLLLLLPLAFCGAQQITPSVSPAAAESAPASDSDADAEALFAVLKTSPGETAEASRPAAINAAATANLSADYPYVVRINISGQVVAVFGKNHNGQYTVPVRSMICSTGAYNQTPTGSFRISDKYRWHLMQGNVYSQYMSRIYGGIAIHSIPYKLPASDTLFATKFNSLGTPVSAGCIRLRAIDAKWVYDNCPSGTTVEVYQKASWPGVPDRFVGVKIPTNITWDPSDPLPGNPYSHINTDPIPYAAANNSLLSSIRITNNKTGYPYSVSPGFSPTATNYSLVVKQALTQINITASAQSPHAAVAGTGVYNLPLGTTTIQLKGIAQTGAITTYTITVTRLSNESRLSSLKLYDATGKRYSFTKGFDRNTKTYYVAVPDTVNAVSLQATALKSGSTLKGNTSHTLRSGQNTLKVSCTSPDGSKTTSYSVVVYRGQADTSLANMKVTDTASGKPLSLGLLSYPLQDNLSLVVPDGCTSVSVTGAAVSPFATIRDSGTHTLNYGPNELPLTVYAHASCKQTYTLRVYRGSFDSNLTSLAVKDEVSGVSYPVTQDITRNQSDYYISLPSAVSSSLSLDAKAADSRATIQTSGALSFTTGENTLTVTCVSSNGLHKTDYTLHVYRGDDVETRLTSLALYAFPIDNSGPIVLSPAFSADICEYDVSLPPSVENLQVLAKAAPYCSAIDGASAVYSSDDRSITLTCRAHEGAAPTTYTIRLLAD